MTESNRHWQTWKAYTPQAHKIGHADGVFKRPMLNPYEAYSSNWHGYNAGYYQGHAENIATDNLTGSAK